MELLVEKPKVRLFYCDITEQEVDAIMNAANPNLMEGGVDGAIRRKVEPRINEECRRIRETMWPGGLLTGSVVITSGGVT